ncbi:MAG: hypothetical protein N2C14_33945 [Planctomycetales bacterium]
MIPQPAWSMFFKQFPQVPRKDARAVAHLLTNSNMTPGLGFSASQALDFMAGVAQQGTRNEETFRRAMLKEIARLGLRRGTSRRQSPSDQIILWAVSDDPGTRQEIRETVGAQQISNLEIRSTTPEEAARDFTRETPAAVVLWGMDLARSMHFLERLPQANRNVVIAVGPEDGGTMNRMLSEGVSRYLEEDCFDANFQDALEHVFQQTDVAWRRLIPSPERAGAAEPERRSERAAEAPPSRLEEAADAFLEWARAAKSAMLDRLSQAWYFSRPAAARIGKGVAMGALFGAVACAIGWALYGSYFAGTEWAFQKSMLIPAAGEPISVTRVVAITSFVGGMAGVVGRLVQSMERTAP